MTDALALDEVSEPDRAEVVAVKEPVFSETNCNVTVVPGGICDACTTTLTGDPVLITVSGTEKLPVGEAGTVTPPMLVTWRLPGWTVGRYMFGLEVMVYGALMLQLH